MAVGDDAAAAGYPLVPNASVGGEVRNGALELNRTRDFVGQVKALVLAVWPVSKGGTGGTTAAEARTNLGICGAITYSPDPPTGGQPGDVHFQYLP